METIRYAALDLGSNNCRLLIATPKAKRSRPSDLPYGGVHIVESFSRSTRLGEGLGHSGRLSPAAMSRAREALMICQRKIIRNQVGRIGAYATEACRRACNAPDFLSLVKQQIGLDVTIISTDREARLAAQGCLPLAIPDTNHVLVFDIGGASTQIIWLERANQKAENNHWHWRDSLSIQQGVVVLYDRIGSGPFLPADYQKEIKGLMEQLFPFEARNRLAAACAKGDIQLIGTSGTVTTLSGVLSGLTQYNRLDVDGKWIDRGQTLELNHRLLQESAIERRNYGCIGPDRAKLIAAGGMLLEAIWSLWPAPKLRVADRGLREGILSQMMVEDGHYIHNGIIVN